MSINHTVNPGGKGAVYVLYHFDPGDLEKICRGSGVTRGEVLTEKVYIHMDTYIHITIDMYISS